ncbi:MAG: N-6 DNA methylase [Acidimicrobiaceae bacterium]|nr:N-6 DNA methylase [Acidimicrobiaceae bacterium]
MNATKSAAPLKRALEALGYTDEYRRDRVGAPADGTVADVVAFTHIAPQDLRTSAISAFTAPANGVEKLLHAAQLLATPFALIEDPSGGLALYSVSAAGQPPAELLRRIAPTEVPELRGSELAADLAPRVIRAAKAGLRQLTLFPMDARLLVNARGHSAGSISARLKASFRLALEYGIEPTTAARLAIESLAAWIVPHKHGLTDIARRNVVSAALNHHGEYFSKLAEWEMSHPDLVDSILAELGDGVDYSTIDARSINAVYEQLFLTRGLRKEFGIFHTDQQLAARILDHLPIEEISPEDRYVVDPACGSGNLLLAAQERLENLSPTDWSPEDTHRWLRTHMYGSDIEPIAVEIAKLSLLVSSLPLGNSWHIERRNAVNESMNLRFPPTVWVTNPPWQFHPDSRAEKATRFLDRAVEHLADGGLLACILPASWLSTRTHRKSRREVSEKCSVFEVWRLPRDMFREARFPAAVVFAQKSRSALRPSFAFRWVTASSKHRSDFLRNGTVQFQSLERTRPDGQLVGGPVDDLTASGIAVKDVAAVSAGVSLRGTPHPSLPGEGTPILASDAPKVVHRAIDAASITWVSDPTETFRSFNAAKHGLLDAPKLLVQADRFPDNAWRLRPVVDLMGVIPSGSWQIVSGQPQTVWALNAYLSTSIASCFVHSHSIARRIAVDVLEQIPLPGDWRDGYESLFADLGRQMAEQASDLPSLVDQAEQLALRAFDLEEQAVAAIERVMAGYEAPDGRVRIVDEEAPRDRGGTTAGQFNQAPGTVKRVGRTEVEIWVLGGPDEGLTVKLHEGIPGWLLEKDATFELTGDPQTGRYRLHRVAHLSDDQILNLDVNRRLASATSNGRGSNSSETQGRHNGDIA